MRKTLLISLAAAVALVTAAVAVAAVFTAVGVKETTATFSAAQDGNLRTRTCTGADNAAFTVTNGHYTGSADFLNPATELDGRLTINARTTYSTTDNLGYVEGSFRVKDDPTRLAGRFSGTLKGTQLVGFLTAWARGNHARVLGNLSATFVPATGFTSGAIGSGSSTAVLAVVAGPICKHPKPAPRPARPVNVSGEVTALSATEITVTSKGPTTTKCAIAAGSPSTTGVLNKRVEMRCEYLGTAPNQVWTLTRLHVKS